MSWNLLLTDLNGVPHGDILNASDRKVGLPHMRIPSCSFKVPLEHPLADTLMNTDTLVRAYRTDPIYGTRSLPFHGPVVSAEEASSGDDKGVAVVAAGPMWRLGKRLIGKSTAGYAQGTVSPVDLGYIAHTILDTVNGEQATGIDKGTRDAVTTGGIGPWWMKKASEAIAELHVGVNSFEYIIDPTEPENTANGPGNWPRIGTMRIAPYIGNIRPDAVFEYGTTVGNVTEYKRAVDREGLMNKAWIAVQGWPDAPIPGYDLMAASDPVSIAQRGLFEDQVPDNEVVDNALRQSMIDYHLIYRKAPKEMLSFSPAVNATPSPLTDYVPGDTVRARAVVGGSVRIDSQFRIWGLTFNIDQNGNENIELELVMP